MLLLRVIQLLELLPILLGKSYQTDCCLE